MLLFCLFVSFFRCLFVVCLFVCLVFGCLFGVWLVGWLVGWFVGWLVGWMVGWLVGWLVGLLLFVAVVCCCCFQCNASITSFCLGKSLHMGLSTSKDARQCRPTQRDNGQRHCKFIVHRKTYNYVCSFHFCEKQPKEENNMPTETPLSDVSNVSHVTPPQTMSKMTKATNIIMVPTRIRILITPLLSAWHCGPKDSLRRESGSLRREYDFLSFHIFVSPLPRSRIRCLAHNAKQRAEGVSKIWSWWGPLLFGLPWSDTCFATWVAHQWPPAHNGERMSADTSERKPPSRW